MIGLAYLCVVAWQDHRATARGDLAVITVLTLSMPLVLAFGIVSMSDVIIDDTGIGRAFFGVKWKWISWANVRSFRIGNSSGLSSGGRIYQSIWVVASLSGSPGSERKATVFGTKVNDREEMIRLLNQYVAKYQVPVMETSKGVRRKVDRIP